MAQPDLIPMPFGQNATPGTIEPIPATTPTVPQDATWSAGFPQVTMQPLASGGIPPRGQNFNGVLNALSQHIFHMQGGGQYKWDAAHGPYSIGDVLQSDDGLRSYVSVVNNNTDNFNATPSAIGDTWLPWSGGAASELVAGLVQLATTAEAQALTDDAKALTPKKLGDAMNAHVLGMGQTWQNVTGSRVANATYTNTTGRPILVIVTFRDLGAGAGSLVVNGVVLGWGGLGTDAPQGFGVDYPITGLVPPGSSYSATIDAAQSIDRWVELR